MHIEFYKATVMHIDGERRRIARRQIVEVFDDVQANDLIARGAAKRCAPTPQSPPPTKDPTDDNDGSESDSD